MTKSLEDHNADLQKVSNEKLGLALSAAEDVLQALAGKHDYVHPDNCEEMVKLWDDLNDRYAPPEFIKSIVSELIAFREAAEDIFAYHFPGDEDELPGLAYPQDLDEQQKGNCKPLYAAPQLP